MIIILLCLVINLMMFLIILRKTSGRGSERRELLELEREHNEELGAFRTSIT